MFCTQCGGNLREDARFCASCGQRISEDVSAADTVASQLAELDRIARHGPVTPDAIDLAFTLTHGSGEALPQDSQVLLASYNVVRCAKDMLLWYLCALDMDPGKRDKASWKRLGTAIGTWQTDRVRGLLRLLPFPEMNSGPDRCYRALEHSVDVISAAAISQSLVFSRYKMSRELAESFVLSVQGAWYSEDEQRLILGPFNKQ